MLKLSDDVKVPIVFGCQLPSDLEIMCSGEAQAIGSISVNDAFTVSASGGRDAEIESA